MIIARQGQSHMNIHHCTLHRDLVFESGWFDWEAVGASKQHSCRARGVLPARGAVSATGLQSGLAEAGCGIRISALCGTCVFKIGLLEAVPLLAACFISLLPGKPTAVRPGLRAASADGAEQIASININRR